MNWQTLVTIPETNMAPENQWLEDVMSFCLMTYFHGCLLWVSGSACLSASFLGMWNAFSKAQPGPLMQFMPLLVFPANGLMVLMEFLNPPPFICRALHVGSRVSDLRNPFLNLLVHHLQVKWVSNISGSLHRFSRFQTWLLQKKKHQHASGGLRGEARRRGVTGLGGTEKTSRNGNHLDSGWNKTQWCYPPVNKQTWKLRHCDGIYHKKW